LILKLIIKLVFKTGTMEKDLQEIENITFGIFSAEEIKNIAVCEVNSPKLCSVDKNTGYGTVYDPRMGTLENGRSCETCGQNVWQCSGHYGYIELNEAIVHPLFYRRVVDFLKCICLKCNKLMITDDQIDLNGFNKILSTKRFTKILEKIEKIDICSHCSYSQPDIKYLTTDNTISMVYKQKNKKKISIILPVDEIKKIFDNISDDDVKLLGFNPSLMHPRNLILTVFPVIPPTARPYIIAEGQMCDDDLTIQIVEIIKANNHLKVGDESIPEVKRQRASQSLKFRISTFYNNSCLAPETPVLMWDGSIKRAEQIEMDDELVGDDGTKRIVKYTCSGEDDMYEITQEKGDKYVVNKEHYLSLRYIGNLTEFTDYSNKIIDYKLKEFLLLPEEIQKQFCGIRKNEFHNISVKYLGKGNYNGFGVDKNHRFLLGDYTVTHNSGKAKHTTNGRSIKGLKERLTGKDGLIRTNLMGKRCSAKGTKIILWNGEIKNVENIKIGDTLIGNDGEKRTVLKLFNGTDQMYKIKQGNGNEYIINSEHILTFKFIHNKKISWKNCLDSWYTEWVDTKNIVKKTKKLKPTKNRTKEEAYEEMKEFVDSLDDNNTINIPVLEYLKLSDESKKLLYGYKIEKPVNWDHKEIDIDPYIFGMWLGDGYKSGTGFASVDSELIEYWKKWADKNNMCVNMYLDNQNVHYGISKKKGIKRLYFKEKLTKYGVLNNKFIPKEYMINSKEVRLALLAGLIDTDGSVEQGGVTIRIAQGLMHKAIIDGARFIADSLGFQTSINKKKTSWKHDGIKKYGDALVLTISGNGAENIPTILPRKKCRSPLIAGNNWTKIKVEPYKVGEFYGFEIDGNNLFVLPDFTVLHNCEQTGRTVIGPDPTLRMGEIGVPREMASNLTVPIQVTNYNFNYLTNLINDGKVERVFSDKIDPKTGKKETITFYLKEALFSRGTILQQGDIIFRKDKNTGNEMEIVVNNGKDLLQPGDILKRNGEFIPELKYPGRKQFNLKIGDICERQLTNGDILLLNPNY
jgi:hypothetical protein